MADSNDLTIEQGRTFTLVIYWETEPIVRKPITDVSFNSGAPRITAVAHGMTDGWRAYVAGVKGPKQLNAGAPLQKKDLHSATVIGVDEIEFNDITPVDENGNEWPAYQSGGFLVYNTPMSLAGYSGRMKIKDKIGGTVLASTEASDAPLNILHIDVDDAAKTITLTINASDTEELNWARGSGVYDLEMVSGDPEPVVTAIQTGKVFLTREVTA